MFNAQSITYDLGRSQEIDPVRQYVSTRYKNWLEFATYHCTKAGIEDESIDVLNEVIVSLLERYQNDVNRLITTKTECGRYMEIDSLVLRMVRLNVYSPTSPYQHKFKPIPADKGVNWKRLRIIDEPDDSIDTPAVILKQMRLVRWVFKGLGLTPFERQVFEWKWEQGESFSHWPGPETVKALYDAYNTVLIAINEVLFYYNLSHFRLIDNKDKKLTNRQAKRHDELAQEFVKTHKVSKKTRYSLQLN